MSKKNGYVCLDKNLTQYMPLIDREYSLVEALFSYAVDQDKGKIGTISGYSTLWSWSRHRVRNLLKTIKSETGHYPDRKQTLTRHPVHFIDVGLREKPDTNPTEPRQNPDTTIEPKPKPKEVNNVEFERFWNEYDKKVGSKTKCCKKFYSLKTSDRNSIFNTLQKYKKSTPDKQYRKNPMTYLNNESWNDEIITNVYNLNQHQPGTRIKTDEEMNAK